MHVWEITIFLENEYEEISDKQTQERYHNFVTKIINDRDVHYQVEHYPNKMVIQFCAQDKDALDNIIKDHNEIFRDIPPRKKPLEMKQRIYEQF